ncbi:alpha/beta hydrolase-fold protein [Actinomadura fulvescens]|uniref:Alpha/beta hydrolase-fold protein n=1 Tax=Actinomadura fulvescens TaxID=46160 RepID=A0ABN3Q3Y1_9ACTN
MQLTSDALLGALAVTAVLGLAVTVWLLPRFSGRSVQAVIARLTLLLACQLAILLALLSAVNSYFSFYVTWSDLLGTQKGTGKIREGQSPAGSAAGRPLARTVSRLNADVDLRVPAKDGQLEEVKIQGPRTGLEVKAFAYLPPEYFRPEFAKRRFPVVVFLTGYPGDAKGLIVRQNLVRTAAEEMKAGRVQPTIYIITRSTVVPPRDTECTDIPSGPQVKTFFSQDVPESLKVTYRLSDKKEGWAVAGQSTGGYCAAKLALLHSDRFGAAATQAGYFTAIKDSSTRDLYGGSQAVRNDNDLIWRLQHLPPPPVSILVASSRVGEINFPQAERFSSLARPPLRVDRLTLDEGGHNFTTFRRMMPETMRWLSARQRADG